METVIKSIADAGVGVVVSGSAIGEMALHFINKFKMMAVRIPSKFDLRRFCRQAAHPFPAETPLRQQQVTILLTHRATGATAVVKVGTPQADELGFADSLSTEDIGGSNVIVLQQPPDQGQICTVVLRGATEQLLDDLERAIDDGVNTYKVSELQGACRGLLPDAGLA